MLKPHAVAYHGQGFESGGIWTVKRSRTTPGIGTCTSVEASVGTNTLASKAPGFFLCVITFLLAAMYRVLNTPSYRVTKAGGTRFTFTKIDQFP